MFRNELYHCFASLQASFITDVSRIVKGSVRLLGSYMDNAFLVFSLIGSQEIFFQGVTVNDERVS